MISRISLSGFRGIKNRAFNLTKKSAIIGMNGSGKTHILEAIHLVSGGQLHYFQAPREEHYNLELSIDSLIGPRTYNLIRNDGREEFRIQGGKVTSIKYKEDLPYRTVFLSPFDMNLLYFAPAIRRDYLDSILSRAYAQFPKIKREYEAAMRQRNALLKKIRDHEVDKKNLDYWDRVFAEKAQNYHQYRKSLITFIEQNSKVFLEFLPKYKHRFSYISKFNERDDIQEFTLAYLHENRDRDIITGHTHIGPHLDDFILEIQYQGDTQSFLDATLVLSRGETKVLLLALKQIEILFLKKIFQSPIVLLFDDIFAELDQNYAEHVIETFDVDQVVFTTQRVLPVSEKWEEFSCINLELQ
ncbi:MAG: DNA replication/repair protein RecF [Candidatus Altimarinota bacterium]